MAKTEIHTVKDLKEGMMIQYRDGRLRKVQKHDGEMIVNSLNGFTSLSNFSSDLTCDSNSDLDIMEVYEQKRSSPCEFFSFDLKDFELVWSREDEEVLELSLAEVAKKFGVKVTNVKIVEK